MSEIRSPYRRSFCVDFDGHCAAGSLAAADVLHHNFNHRFHLTGKVLVPYSSEVPHRTAGFQRFSNAQLRPFPLPHVIPSLGSAFPRSMSSRDWPLSAKFFPAKNLTAYRFPLFSPTTNFPPNPKHPEYLPVSSRLVAYDKKVVMRIDRNAANQKRPFVRHPSSFPEELSQGERNAFRDAVISAITFGSRKKYGMPLGQLLAELRGHLRFLTSLELTCFHDLLQSELTNQVDLSGEFIRYRSPQLNIREDEASPSPTMEASSDSEGKNEKHERFFHRSLTAISTVGSFQTLCEHINRRRDCMKTKIPVIRRTDRTPCLTSVDNEVMSFPPANASCERKKWEKTFGCETLATVLQIIKEANLLKGTFTQGEINILTERLIEDEFGPYDVSHLLKSNMMFASTDRSFYWFNPKIREMKFLNMSVVEWLLFQFVRKNSPLLLDDIYQSAHFIKDLETYAEGVRTNIERIVWDILSANDGKAFVVVSLKEHDVRGKRQIWIRANRNVDMRDVAVVS